MTSTGTNFPVALLSDGNGKWYSTKYELEKKHNKILIYVLNVLIFSTIHCVRFKIYKFGVIPFPSSER